MPRVNAAATKKSSCRKTGASFSFSANDKRRLLALLSSSLSKTTKETILAEIESHLTGYHVGGEEFAAPLKPAEIRTIFNPLLREAKKLRAAIEATPRQYLCLPETRGLYMMQDRETRERMLADGLVLPLTVIDYLREFEDAVGHAISKRGKGESRGQPKQRYKTYIVWTIYGLICQSESDKDKIVDFVHRVLIAGRVTRKHEEEEDERTTTIGLIREAKKEYRGARK